MSDENTKIITNLVPEVVLQPLVGRADHRLDPKRRFTIPADWYERLGCPKQVYAMPSLSGLPCLDVFSPVEFDRKLEKFRDAQLMNKEVAMFTSQLGELIDCVMVDVQNRIRLKESLLNHASLKEDVVLIGRGYHFEVWSLINRPKLDGSEAKAIGRLLELASNVGGI